MRGKTVWARNRAFSQKPNKIGTSATKNRDIIIFLTYSDEKILRQKSENAMKPKTVGRVVGQDPMAHPNVMPARKAGFVSGTILLTQEGEMPVEFLSPGDRIITRDAGMVTLESVRHRRVTTRAISFAAGSLGDTRPQTDLVLPAAQMVLIRDWRAMALFGVNHAIARADALVDGEFICDLGPQKMLLHQLNFADQHIVYGGGLELSCEHAPDRDLRPAA